MTTRAATMLARAPVPGQAKTRLARGVGDVAAASLHAAMVLDVLEDLAARAPTTLAVTGSDDACAAFLATARAAVPGLGTERQAEGDLGRRIATGLARRLSEGAAQAFVLGSDCLEAPGLLDAAAAALRDADVVLGPAQDGGFVLIAARVRLPDRALEGVAWGGPSALAETRAALDRAGLRVHRLAEVLDDVDDVAGLRRLAERLRKDGGAAAPRTRAWLEAHGADPA